MQSILGLGPERVEGSSRPVAEVVLIGAAEVVGVHRTVGEQPMDGHWY